MIAAGMQEVMLLVQLAVLVGALLLCFRVCAYTCKTRHSSPALLANTLLRLCNTALASHSSLPPLYPPPPGDLHH